MAKKDKDRIKTVLDGKVNDFVRKVEMGCIPMPTRVFIAGEKVEYGAHDKTEIIESHDDMFYTIRNYGTRLSYGQPEPYDEQQVVQWSDLFKLNTKKDTEFTNKDPLYLNFTQRTLESLLNMSYNSGLDINPDYQRELVWNDDDKEKLIDSIFNKIDIGKFAIAKRPYKKDEKTFEVIDGKQRITTLLDFHQDLFKYKDVFYSELSNHDKHTFLDYSVQICILENCDLKDKLDAFICLNTRGKDMAEDHINRVIEMRNDLEDDQSPTL